MINIIYFLLIFFKTQILGDNLEISGEILTKNKNFFNFLVQGEGDEFVRKIGKIVYKTEGNESLQNLQKNTIILYLNYKGLVQLQIPIFYIKIEKEVLASILFQFFQTIYKKKEHENSSIFFPKNNSIFSLKFVKDNIIILEKRYMLFPISILNQEAQLETREILYESTSSIAYQLWHDSKFFPYKRLAKQIIKELEEQILKLKK